MTFHKLGYVNFKPEKSNNFSGELIDKIINLLGEAYDDDISIHHDDCDDIELWLNFSKEDINYKNLIGELLTQEEYNALVENDATTILFY